MNINNINRTQFCSNQAFLQSVVNLLNNYILSKNTQYDKNNSGFILTSLIDVYDDMSKDLNVSGILNLYFTNGLACLLTNTGKISTVKYGHFAGHDIPVWLNNPSSAYKKIMVIGQDPRRNEKEMQSQSNCITLSSPFGLHSHMWRTHKQNGLIPQIFVDLITECEFDKKVLCVYFTDLYKFRRADYPEQKSVIDSVNMGLYMDVLLEEVCNFKPDLIIPVGCTTASVVMNQTIKITDCFILHRKKYFPILHPSGLNNANISEIKAKYKYPGSTFDFYKYMIRPLI